MFADANEHEEVDVIVFVSDEDAVMRSDDNEDELTTDEDDGAGGGDVADVSTTDEFIVDVDVERGDRGRDKGANVDLGDKDNLGDVRGTDDLDDIGVDDLDKRDNDLDADVLTGCHEVGDNGSSVTVAGWAMIGPSWGTGEVGELGLMFKRVAGAGLDGFVGVVSSKQFVLPFKLEVGVSVILLERHKDSATLVDLLKESLMAEIRDKDSLILQVRGRFSPSWETATSGSPRLVALVIGRGDGEWIAEEEEQGRCNESKEVLKEWVGLSLLGDPGVPLLPDIPPMLAKEVVEPSLVPHRNAGEDCDG